jgi:hypothetical protein
LGPYSSSLDSVSDEERPSALEDSALIRSFKDASTASSGFKIARLLELS